MAWNMLNLYSLLGRSIKFHVLVFSFRLTAKAVAVLLPILGSSWIFGVLAVNDHALVFQYMFAVFNSLQVSTWRVQISAEEYCTASSLATFS